MFVVGVHYCVQLLSEERLIIVVAQSLVYVLVISIFTPLTVWHWLKK